MEKQLPWIMFVEKLNLLEDLIETYYELRKEFKKEGWTERDLEMPPYYPNGVMMRYGNFNSQKAKVFNLIRSYGFKTDYDDYVHYLQNILKVIDENTPLN